MELLYFTDISQLDYVRSSMPDMLKKMRPVTGDMVVSFELERLGVDFIDEWGFLTPEDIEKNSETAHLLSKTWWDERLASTEYEGFSLTDAAQQDLVYPFEASLNARTVYEKIFGTYPVEKISGYFLPSVGVVRTGPSPASRAVRSVTQAILFYMAERHGISVDRLNSSLSLTLGSIANRGRSLSSIKAAKFSEANDVSGKIILVYETGMPVSEHDDLMEALDRLPGVKAISISQNVLELGTQFDVESGLQPFWNKFVESIGNYQGDYPEIFANSHLQFQFERIKREMESASAYGDVFAVFLELLNPSLVIFGHEAFTIDRTLVRLARNRKIPTAGLVHGGLGFKFAFRGIIGEADIVMVWNGTDIEWLTSFGVDKSRLNKIGSLRYESNYIEYANGYGIDSHKTKRAAKDRLGVDQGKPLIVLLTAAINTGLAAPVADPSKHREAIRGIISLVESRPDLQFIIKAHPSYDYYELYRRLLDSKRPNLMFLEHKTLGEILEASDICLMINYCTTASLEAMLHRVPVVYLDNAVYPLRDWQDNLSETGTHRVATITELEKCLDSLLTNPVAKELALVGADKQIKETLDIKEFPASSRLLDFIKCVLDDQQTGNVESMLNAQTMRDFLYSTDSQKDMFGERFTVFAMKHSGEHLMFAFAYLAGVNNLGLATLRRIFEVFQDHMKNETVMSWKKAQWFLLPAYITGNINNSMRDGSKLNTIWSLRQYLICPQKFISAPALFKRYVIKHLIRIILGHTDISFLNWILKIYYHFSNAIMQKKRHEKA